MGRSVKINRRKVAKAQKLLSELPVKDNRCSREEAVGLLEKDLRKAFKRGYSPEDIYALFKKEHIPIPTFLLSKYFDEDAPDDVKKIQPENEECTESMAPDVPSTGLDDPYEQEQISNPAEKIAHPQSRDGQNENKAVCNSPKPLVKYGTFEITPDIPIGEL